MALRELNAEQLAILAETTAAVADMADLDGALRALVSGVARLTGADCGGVRLISDRSDPFGRSSMYFWMGGNRYEWRDTNNARGSNTAIVLETGRALYTPDISLLTQRGDAAALQARKDGIASSLIAPLRAGGLIIGTLHADAYTARAFSDDQLVLLQVLADYAGGAVEQARWRGEAQEALRRADATMRVSAAVNAGGDLDEMLARVLAEAVAVVGARAGMLALVDEDRRYVRGRVGFNQSEGIVEATIRQLYDAAHPDEDIYAIAIRTDEQLLFDDTHPALNRDTMRLFPIVPGRHRVLTPIRHADEAIGVLSVVWHDNLKPQEADYSILRLLAEQAGGAIARARLMEAEHVSRRRAERFVEAARVVSGSVNMRDTLRRTLAAVQGMWRTDGVVIYLVGDDGTTLEPAAARGVLLKDANPSLAARALVAREIAALPDTAVPCEVTVTRLEDGRAPRSAYAIPLLLGDRPIAVVEGLYGSLHDVASMHIHLAHTLAHQVAVAMENARLHELVVRERRQLEAMLRGASEGHALIDEQGRVVFWSEQMSTILGIPAEFALGAKVREIVERVGVGVEDPREFARLHEDALARLAEEPTFVYVLEGPPRRVVRSQYFPVIGTEGQVLGRGHQVRDVTEEQAHLERLQHLNRIKSEFVSTVSHELRTPLTSIQGYSELIRDEELTREEIKEFAGVITNSAQALSRMIGDMLDLDRLESGRMMIRRNDVDVNRLITEVVGGFGATVTHRLVLCLEPSLPPLLADRDRLARVIINLVSNAVKYSPDGGAITMTSGVEDGDLSLTIRDEGPGIPAEALEAIFERYTRLDDESSRHIQGTGLGLPIARQIVQMHGGHLWAERGEERGMIFHVRLPFDPTPRP